MVYIRGNLKGATSLKWHVIGGALIVASLTWFVYNIFFIQEGDVVFTTDSPTGEFKVFVSEKESLFGNKPKYVASFVKSNVHPDSEERIIFYYSPDEISYKGIEWKNKDTIIIGERELQLPLDRHHHFIR